MKILTALLLAALLTGCGYTPHKEDAAQVGDAASTALALESGQGQEANPIVKPLVDAGPAGYVALLVLKAGINHGIRQLDTEQCKVGMRFATTSGWGLTGNNLAIAAGASSGLAIPLGIGAAIGHYLLTKDSDLGCVARTGEPLTEEQAMLLRQWAGAYTSLDADGLAEILDNPAEVEAYREFFAKMESIEAAYSNMSQTQEGFAADYEATWRRKDGTTEERSGTLEWKMEDGRIVDAS